MAQCMFHKYLNPILQVNNSQLGTVWPPRDHLVMSGDVCGYHDWRGVLLESSG